MYKILFVCHGNICRSPMAEFVLRDMVKKLHEDKNFLIASAATSSEEIGNPVHYGTRRRLQKEGISVEGKTAVKLRKDDYGKYDYIIGMEEINVIRIKGIVGDDSSGKIFKLLDFADGGDIADPWYTGDFDATFNDVVKGCMGLLEYLKIC